MDYDVRDPDKIIWKVSKSGDLSFKETYKTLSGTVEDVDWTKLVWFKHNIPRHSFVCWLACHKRFKTRAKLRSWGLIENANCVFCDSGIEDEDHMFLKCLFSNFI